MAIAVLTSEFRAVEGALLINIITLLFFEQIESGCELVIVLFGVVFA
jgi:hypothetical protein